MRVVRQRLLLFAGWALAAVGSGLIASGAVAVAGGQVTDRPLRPLSAAEVEALLPVLETDDSANASGGRVSSDGEAVSGTAGDVDSPGTSAGEQEPPARLPTPPRVIRPSDAPVPPAAPLPGSVGQEPDVVVAEPDEPSQSEIVALRGGALSVAGTADGVLLLWATPRPGFAYAVDYGDGTVLRVTFISTGHRSSVEASWVDDRLVLVTAEVDDLT